MGLTYLEPNHFNQTSCVASLRHIHNHGGQVNAASVRRIAACPGCSECKKNPDGTCKCGTYKLPIVSNVREAQQIVASLTHGTGKRAALVARHNKEFNARQLAFNSLVFCAAIPASQGGTTLLPSSVRLPPSRGCFRKRTNHMAKQAASKS